MLYNLLKRERFGDVDGDGISENMNIQEVGEEQALTNRQKVVKWYIDEVYKRWSQTDYSELDYLKETYRP
ncbi:DUF4855 domain-containing protein [Paenibacillus sp. N3/727]|uniref:DUF4855 domain-containing protein n=1 Tax=Paenibacillus sp. N3/727 TaxID=2925845 RepID=UPI001F53D4C4|nr:DUF4855 domain-containing protein [Paenibacillus sp. N3/727]UNK19637.1 DUF4855 domain-containing protein [Paenibacillus sp. N3/727]